jgi:hypothetical protein
LGTQKIGENLRNLRTIAASWHWLPALAVAIAALGVYALTLAPGLTWAHDGADGGELAAAVFSGGVPHPPGYPAYLLAAGLAAQLPLGEPALRLNLFSALCAAVAAGLIALTGARLSGSRLAGAAAGLLWAWSPIVWGQAVITEVYTLNVLLIAALAWLALRGSSAPPGFQPGAAATLGALLGLAIAGGPTALFALPLAALACGRAPRRWAALAGGTLLGLALFAVLPLRALAGPAINWGDASRLDGFLWLVSARPYAGLAFGLPPAEWPQRALALLGLLARQFTPAGLVLAALGLAWLARRTPALAAAGALAAGGYGLFAAGYASADSYVLLIPALALAAPWLAAGLVAAARQTARPAPALAAVAALLVAVQLTAGYGPADASGDRRAERWLEDTLAGAPEDAVLVSARDQYTFALWYSRYARGARPDVTVVDRDLWAFDWYRGALARETGVELSAGLSPENAFAGRPVCTLAPAGVAGCSPGAQSRRP